MCDEKRFMWKIPVRIHHLFHMKRLLAFGLFTIATLAANAQNATPPAAAKEVPFGNKVLEQALHNNARLSSFHASAEITTPIGKATLDGDLGEGTLSFSGKDAKGVRKKRIVADNKFFLSADDGKTWKTGGDADRDGTIFLSNVVTGPLTLELKIWEKGQFEAKEEKLGDEEVLRVEKPAKGKEPAVTFWLAREEKFKNAVFVRKVNMIITSEAGDLPVAVTYTKLNDPVTITAPAVK